MKGSWRRFGVTTGAAGLFFAALAVGYFRNRPVPLGCQLSLYGCLILLVAMALGPAFSGPRAWLLRRRAVAIPALLLPYFVYAVGCGDLRAAGLVRLLAIAVPPVVIYTAFPVRKPGAWTWRDTVAWSWLALAVVLRQMRGIWVVPENLDFMGRLFAIALGAWCWVILRPIPGLGYDFEKPLRTVAAALGAFAGFAAIAVPAGLKTGFAAWRPRWHGPAGFLVNYAEIFIFIAWLEELFYRGVLQRLLAGRLKSPWRAQAVASVIFGLSHILLGSAPNWRYVAFATVAGWFYGWAYRWSGNLVAPSLAHALVDAAWRTWFGGRG